jgi:hypothetical protein
MEACEECRREVYEMQHCSALIQALRAPAETEPAPGFYSRLMDGIASQARPSPWSVFLDPYFGKRLVYATLTALLVMGTYFIATERGQVTVANSAPEAIMATQAGEQPFESQQPPDHQTASDRDRVLVQLSTYRQ